MQINENKSSENATATAVLEILPGQTSGNKMIAGIWPNKLLINENHFTHKSLSHWAINPSIGCSHGCTFCYVPSTSVNKQTDKLGEFGVSNPDAGWGYYTLLRQWDENAFLNSLLKAELEQNLSSDGNRAVIYCSTTDAYQTISGVKNHKGYNQYLKFLVRQSLKLILECSTLNVRILTRSPLAKRDFDLFKSFGNRLLFGMSLPTLNDKWAKVYEPDAPGVEKRLATLQAAKEAGLNVYVAVAPTFPECDAADLRRTLEAVKKLDPITIFHEPINIRAENVARIEAHAKELGVRLNTEVFATPDAWRIYATGQLMQMQAIAEELDIADKLKLWPDSALIAKSAFFRIRKDEFQRLNPSVNLTHEEKQILEQLTLKEFEQFNSWVGGWWDKVSEWPGVPSQAGWVRPPLLTASPFTPVTLERIKRYQAEAFVESQKAGNTEGANG